MLTSYGCIDVTANCSDICQEGNEFDAKLFPDISDDV